MQHSLHNQCLIIENARATLQEPTNLENAVNFFPEYHKVYGNIIYTYMRILNATQQSLCASFNAQTKYNPSLQLLPNASFHFQLKSQNYNIIHVLKLIITIQTPNR